MTDTPKILDQIVDTVLAYRPKKAKAKGKRKPKKKKG
jgi:hypothetical protein